MSYRNEYPNPQFERENWICLNGEWDFETDYSVSGKQRDMFKASAEYTKKINVPFCIESKLSGIEEKDFINSVWYKKTVNIKKEQLDGRVFLNFGAVDYKTTLYVNEKEVGVHIGGCSSFAFEITEFLTEGENLIIINAFDDTRSGDIPSGKQSAEYFSWGCFYTRTTGIWQTVWLEFTPKEYIKKVKYITDTENAVLTVTADVIGCGEFKAEAYFEGKFVGEAKSASNGGSLTLSLPLSEKHLWEVGKGNLYDLKLTYGDDTVKSYFGLRNISISGNKVLINNKPVFQRLILDQGFYPDGIYTAPSEEDLLGDIKRSLDMGFNGARLHQKVFEQRFLYHCDRLGYIVWGEYPSWGLDYTYAEKIYGVLPEWLEIVERDFNHPAIITWCPMNETWDIGERKQNDDLINAIYLATKSADPTRPCIDTSGNYHVATDIYDLHDYVQDTEEFHSHYAPLSETHDVGDFISAYKKRQQYDGKKPLIISEYGGTGWNEQSNAWAYGNSPKSKEEFLDRLEKLTKTLLENENICGFCYTQLTDVEQEQNGLYYYNRNPKFDPEIIKKIFSSPAKIEE